MMFQIFAFAVGAGLAFSTAANAPMLLLASALVAVAGLADTAAFAATACCTLWSYVDAWFSLAALQTGFVVGAYAHDFLGGTTADLSRPLSTTRRDRSA